MSELSSLDDEVKGSIQQSARNNLVYTLHFLFKGSKYINSFDKAVFRQSCQQYTVCTRDKKFTLNVLRCWDGIKSATTKQSQKLGKNESKANMKTRKHEKEENMKQLRQMQKGGRKSSKQGKQENTKGYPIMEQF